jgi:hypothetical protein
MKHFTYAVVGLERLTRRIYLIRLSHKKIQKKSVTLIGTDRVKFQFQIETDDIQEAIRIGEERLNNLDKTVELQVGILKV